LFKNDLLKENFFHRIGDVDLNFAGKVHSKDNLQGK
jgi:hypothetical protein